MSTSLVSITSLSPGGDLSSYINTVNAHPVLTADEERELAFRFYDEGDLDAARELIMSHLRFVVYLARTYRGYGLPEADIIQEGNVGLMKAVKRFDPNVGVRLVSFAVHWIRAEIHEFIIRNWRIVKIATTKAQRKLFFKLRERKKDVGWLTQSETQDIARDLGVRPVDVTHMEGRLSSADLAFDVSDDDEEDGASWAPAHSLVDDSPTALEVIEEEEWADYRQQQLYEAIQTLDERSRLILSSRWLSESKSTLQELAAQFGVSAERIRQIENSAMDQIKEHLVAA